MKFPGVLLIAFLQVTRVTLAGTECATFRPKTCLYDDSVTFSGRQCHPQTCNFDVAKEFECGFVESGTYSYEPEPAGGCVPDAFMSTRRAVPSPCGPRCCRADHAGDFAHKGSIYATNASAYEFQPIDNKCHYESISRGQILHYLHARGAILAVVGDSMMRQFFLRLVMMMRGQQRLLDYHLHTHAQYYACSEVDVFRLARGSSNTSRASVDMEFLKETSPSFFRTSFGPGRAASRASLAACSHSPVEFNYLHAPEWQDQIVHLPQYLKTIPVGVRPVILSSIAYWEQAAEVPKKYLNMLEMLKWRAFKVFIISIPTIRVKLPERRQAYIHRNRVMRDWTEKQGEPFVFLDFDAVSQSQNPPPGGSLTNWHYMCSVSWVARCSSADPCDLINVDHSERSTDDDGRPMPQIVSGIVERIHATEDGQCTDEMNRNLWQIVFNTLLKPARAE